MAIGDFIQLGRRHHLPGGQRAIDNPLGDGFGHLCRRHAHWSSAEGFDQLRGRAAGSAQLEVLQIFQGSHALAAGVDVHAAVTVYRQHLVALEIVAGELLVVLPDDRVARPCSGGKHERQLHGFDPGELARRIGRGCPDDIGDTVADHVSQLGWRSSQLHRWIELALDASGGFLAKLLAPGLDDVALGIGIGGKEVSDLEGPGGFREGRGGSTGGSEKDGELGHLHG
ncbi:hypothetical protein D9M72_194470 [compost metagenome]